MEIELNTNRMARAGSPEPTPARAPVTALRDAAAFTDTAALRTALDQIPEIRPEVVQRARQLATSIAYPPPGAVDSIAKLLAMHLEIGPQTSARNTGH